MWAAPRLQASITVDMGTPKWRPIPRQLMPLARNAIASSRRKTRWGRPIDFPLIFAVLMPATTRSRIISRSSSATAAKTCRRNRALGLFSSVSMFLRGRQETYSQRHQFLDAADAVGHAASPAVQFPYQDRVEAPQPGVPHEPVQLRPAGFGAAPAGVYILPTNLQPAACSVIAEFPQLHFATLVGGADPGVKDGLHGHHTWLDLAKTATRKTTDMPPK